MDTLLKDLPRDYGQVKQPKVAEIPPLPPKGTALPSIAWPHPSVAQAAIPPTPLPPPLLPAPVPIPPQPQTIIQQVPMPMPMGPQPAPAQGDQANDKRPKKWLGTQPTDIRIKREQKEQTTSATPEASKDAKAQALIPVATWAKPLHPELVLYRDQFIPGILLDAANSDIPGQLRVMVTRAVQDRFQSGVVLVPQFGHVICQLTEQPKYGQTRFDITVDQIIFPDGTVVELKKTKLGGADGSTGVSANVNNHWGKLLLGTGLSAILNIGVRSTTGTPSGFYQNPAQEASRDVGQQFQQDANSYVQREFRVPPTLDQAAGTEVSLHLSENLNFSKAPTRVP